ncbi:MAG: DUF5317 domain-containing protein [Actinomycetota bacterium]|nr:DUF5317 domain-containing protein [Actinomycetota bacterium]MDH4353993.1 DUF5317 domain-containing protein [Actinomycetota bacterium]MDH5278852.1 DUF5317 domain-containing protein [Actinomycetota bacterium]
MLVLACGLLAILSPVLFGGDLRRLGMVRFRLVWLPVLALVAQVVIIEVVPDAPAALLEGIHLATYAAAIAFIAANWRIPGLLVVAFGGLLNGVTIALNDGTLPASVDAMRAAGLPVSDSEFINSAVLADPVLPLLGDIFVWPEPLPLANVYSFGDVIIVLGVAYAANKIAGSRWVRTPWQVPGVDTAEPEPASGSSAEASRTSTPGPDNSALPHPAEPVVVGFAPLESLTPLQQRLAALRPEVTGPASYRAGTVKHS